MLIRITGLLALIVLMAGCAGNEIAPEDIRASTQVVPTPTSNATPTPAAQPTVMSLPSPSPLPQEPTAAPAGPGGHPSDHPEVSFGHTHLEAGPHLKLAEMPAPTEADRHRAEGIAEKARRAVSKYRDYRQALADGYEIFAPDVPQDVYHFINFRQAFNGLETGDPGQPAALLYEKNGGEWEFYGVMYAAYGEADPAELDNRYPLSMGQWHAHVNICVPHGLEDLETLASDPRFGFEGSIATRAECATTGGRFFPDVLGWMVHVDLSEKE